MPAQTKSRRTVALLFEYATLNGGERSMLACLDWLRQHDAGWEFVVLAPGSGRLADAIAERRLQHIPFSLVAGDGTRLSNDSIEAALVKAVSFASPDLLHANSLAMGRLAGRIAGRLPVPTTAHLRDIVHLSGAAIADLNRNRRLIAVSQATRDFHVARGLDAARVVVVRNGIDLEQFCPRERTGWLCDELGLPRSAKLLATIGQIGLRKGQDILAAAAPEIARYIPESHFLLIGERSSQKAESVEFEQSISRRFAEHRLASRLHRLGVRDDVARLLNEVNLVVHPANQEPFGRVLLEAAACGVPVVATNVGGTAEIVDDGVTGRLVSPRDSISLATAARELLGDDEAHRRMQIAARDRAIREFDIADASRRLAAVWREVPGHTSSDLV
jgi:glycosyltransferase involved in cell wall biosynthesis